MSKMREEITWNDCFLYIIHHFGAKIIHFFYFLKHVQPYRKKTTTFISSRYKTPLFLTLWKESLKISCKKKGAWTSNIYTQYLLFIRCHVYIVIWTCHVLIVEQNTLSKNILVTKNDIKKLASLQLFSLLLYLTGI